jgi:hypothetical protein
MSTDKTSTSDNDDSDHAPNNTFLNILIFSMMLGWGVSTAKQFLFINLSNDVNDIVDEARAKCLDGQVSERSLCAADIFNNSTRPAYTLSD